MAKLRRASQSKAARNERRKALATTLNAMSVAVLVAALFQPIASGGDLRVDLTSLASALFVVFQYALHYILRRFED